MGEDRGRVTCETEADLEEENNRLVYSRSQGNDLEVDLPAQYPPGIAGGYWLQNGLDAKEAGLMGVRIRCHRSAMSCGKMGCVDWGFQLTTIVSQKVDRP